MNKRLITYGRIFRMCGLGRLARALEPRVNVRVTYTHEVLRKDFASFSRAVEYLAHFRTILTPDRFFSLYLEGKAWERPSILFTFDDGLLSSYHAATEILEPLGARALFFVPTAILDLKTEDAMRRFAAERLYYGGRKATALAPEEYRFMGAEQLRDLVSRGHAVCPHTHSHVFLTEVRDEASALRELIEPGRILADLLGQQPIAFAFPVGTERQMARFPWECIRSHYRFCFTALNGVNTPATDPHRLHRDCLPAEAPLAYVRSVMRGDFDLYYKLKMRRLDHVT